MQRARIQNENFTEFTRSTATAVATTRVGSSILHRVLLRTYKTPLSWNEVVRLATEHRPSVIGLDVFDTVITRSVASDPAVLTAIAHAVVADGLWPGTVEELLAARAQEAAAIPRAPLAAWLQQLEPKGLTSAERALVLEIEIETQLASPIPGAADAIRKLRGIAPLHYVSDMHLPSAVIRQLLERHGLIEDVDSLTVSSDTSSTKSDGGLFDATFGKRLQAANGIVFIGDNRWSDVTQAQKAGAIPVPRTGIHLTTYEAAMARNPRSAGPAIAAAARQVRLTSLEVSPASTDLSTSPTNPRQPLVDPAGIAAQTIGQINVAFLLWIRERCHHHDIGHIEFLARDGELPLRMAEAMPGDYWTGANLGYLQCGRRSWSLAAAPLIGVESWVELGTADDAAFLLHSASTIPFASVLRRCGLDMESLPRSSTLALLDPTKPLGGAAEIQEYSELLNSGVLNQRIVEAARAPLELIQASLKQRQLPAAKIALVDVGWRGQQALLISAIVRSVTGHEPIHLHFGGSGVSADIDRRVSIERFALDDSVRPHPIDAPVSCLELFLASGNARLIGYRRNELGKVEEVFESAASPVDTIDQRALWAGAIDVARTMPTFDELSRWTEPNISLSEETRTILDRFWNRASKAEVAALQPLRFEGDDAGESIGHVIRAYSVGELLGRAPVPRQWRYGSLTMTPRAFRPVMKLYFRVKDALAR